MNTAPVILCPYCAKQGTRTILNADGDAKTVECVVCRNVYWGEVLIREQAQMPVKVKDA